MIRRALVIAIAAILMTASFTAATSTSASAAPKPQWTAWTDLGGKGNLCGGGDSTVGKKTYLHDLRVCNAYGQRRVFFVAKCSKFRLGYRADTWHSGDNTKPGRVVVRTASGKVLLNRKVFPQSVRNVKPIALPKGTKRVNIRFVYSDDTVVPRVGGVDFLCR